MSSLVFPTFNPPNIIAAVQAAQQYKVQQAQLQAMNQKAMLQKQQMQLIPLQGQALAGDSTALSQLQQLNPKIAMDTEKFLEERRKASEAQQLSSITLADKQRAESYNKTVSQIKMLEQVQQNPALLPQTKQYMIANNLLVPEAADGIKTVDDVASHIADLKIYQNIVQDPVKDQAFRGFVNSLDQRDEEAKANRQPVLTPRERVAHIDEYIKGVAHGKGTTIELPDPNAINLEKGAKQKLEEAQATDENTMSSLNSVRDLLPEADKLLSVWGKANEKWINLKSYLSLPVSNADRQVVEKIQRLRANIGPIYQAFKHAISGAAVKDTEMEELRQESISEEMSPARFVAAFKVAEEKTLRAMRLRYRLIRGGLKPDGDTAASFNKEMEQGYSAGDSAMSEGDRSGRAAELMKQYKGVSPEKAARFTRDQMIQEGYWTDAELKAKGLKR